MDAGRVFLLLGAVFLVIGAGLLLLPKDTHLFSWFGNLPGDIVYRRENTVVYIPWVSMLLVSAVISAGMQFIRFVLGHLPSR